MRHIAIMAASVAFIGLTACNQTDGKADDAPAPTPAAAPQPSQMMQETFVDCTWGETQGSGLSVWSYACPQAGNTHMVHDASLPGFALEGTYDGQTARSPTIIVFKKAADAPIDAVLAEIRTKSPGPHTAQCVLARPTYDGVAEGIYHLVPPAPVRATRSRWIRPAAIWASRCPAITSSMCRTAIRRPCCGSISAARSSRSQPSRSGR